MKITEATWEKRNLGVTTYEIGIDYDDDVSCIDSIKRIECEYMVVKVSANNIAIIDEIQELGFRYIEDMIQVEHDLKEIEYNPIWQRLYDACSYRRMTDGDIEQLRDEIKAGMFKDDRISRDKHFGVKVSAVRYLNWFNDLLERGALPYVIRYKEENGGFIVLTTKDGITYSSVLGGGYTKYRKTGLGVVKKEMEITKSLGGKRLISAVSANNPGQVRALIINGYKPYNIEHVFVRHSK
ncbi:MAG: hypothetical protein IJT37_08205 [Lachnospiraceae bacterium]|nr:hypothetical protein [Lachnospiraceae bacterium]